MESEEPKPEEIDHEFTKDPVCPYCGKDQMDFWEKMMDDGEQVTHKCDECDESFVVECIITTEYSTKKTEAHA